MKFMKIILTIAMMLFVVTAATALVNQPLTKPTAVDCSNVTSLGLLRDGIILDNTKIIAFFNSSESDISYYCIKNILGLYDYDMYLEITHFDGRYVTLNNTLLVYGVYPGKVEYSNVLSHIYAPKLGSWVLISPNYVTLGYFSQNIDQLNNDVLNQQIELESEEEGPTILSDTSEYDATYTRDVVVKNMIPDLTKYTNARTFSRLAIMEIDGELTVVKITLGVWH